MLTVALGASVALTRSVTSPATPMQIVAIQIDPFALRMATAWSASRTLTAQRFSLTVTPETDAWSAWKTPIALPRRQSAAISASVCRLPEHTGRKSFYIRPRLHPC